MSEIERREAIELRAGEGRTLSGYAAVFDKPTRILGFTELVKPGAFKRSLAAGADILLLADHDPTKVLARTRNGSLTLREDSRGLFFETGELPNTSWASDTLELVRAGLAGGASFAFRVPRGGERWQGNTRELVNVNLREVSVIAAHPAYKATTVHARNAACRADLAAFIEAVRGAARSLGE